MFEVANLREQCAWIHAFDPDAATRKAMDMLLMAYEKLKTNASALRFEQVKQRVLIVGGGVAGLSCAMALKEMGVEVDLVEKEPYIGGKAIQTFRVWQSQCYPSSCTTACSVLSLTRSAGFEEFNLYTNTEVKAVKREKGNFIVELLKKPLYVDPIKCCSCGKCAEVCPIEVENVFELGIRKRKVIDKDYPTAIPDMFYVLKEFCDECGKCVEVCPSSAINLKEEPQVIQREYGAVVLATGFAEKQIKKEGIEVDGKRVVTPMQLERLLDNRFFGITPRKIAFVISEEEEGHCSVLAWSIAIKLVNILQAKMRVKTTVFYENLPTFSKTTEIFKNEAERKVAVL